MIESVQDIYGLRNILAKFQKYLKTHLLLHGQARPDGWTDGHTFFAL